MYKKKLLGTCSPSVPLFIAQTIRKIMSKTTQFHFENYSGQHYASNNYSKWPTVVLIPDDNQVYRIRSDEDYDCSETSNGQNINISEY